MTAVSTGPRLRAPAGATDAHVHFYGPYDRFPLATTSPGGPPPALVADYGRLQARLGLERVVVVQPAGYAADNRRTMAAVAEIGDAARAVVVVDAEAPEDELRALAEGGAVGLRVFMLEGGIYRFAQVPELAAKVRPFGWHLQLQLDGRLLPEHEATLGPLRDRLVIDHTGKFLEPVPVGHPAFRCLRRLVDGGAYVKLSAPYETSRTGPPLFDDVGALAQGAGPPGAGADALGQQLAPPGPGPRAGRGDAARPSPRLGAGRAEPTADPGRQSGAALRVRHGRASRPVRAEGTFLPQRLLPVRAGYAM